MNILFVHRGFPAQFKFLAQVLAADPLHHVRALSLMTTPDAKWQGIHLENYQIERGTVDEIHPWLGDIEAKIIRGEAALRKATLLLEEGFYPDVIIAHPGWGESLFLKEVWPKAKLGLYCEYFYHGRGNDVGFDPEFTSKDPVCRMQLKNINNLLHFEMADAGLSPTKWQANTFPERFRNKITVVHDGIDTVNLLPNADIGIELNTRQGPQNLTRADELITFVNRNLEPYRGYHIFMRALPSILRERPNAKVLIVGGEERGYGTKPENDTWKNIFFNEIKPQLDEAQLSRIIFLGNVAYAQFISLLQISTVHVYLTYPFVLSWSLLEAMSIGCAIVASDTAPVKEVLQDNETGCLVDFFDQQALADKICYLLDHPKERERLGSNAREYAVKHYDLRTVCLPAQLDWVNKLYDLKSI